MRVERPSLVSRTRPLADPGDLLDALAPDGFAWLHQGAGFVTAGVAARVPVGRGARGCPPKVGGGHVERAAEKVAALLGAIRVENPLRRPGTGPLAVGALPFDDETTGELVIPALVVGRDRAGRGWVTETGPPGPRDPGPWAPNGSVPARATASEPMAFELKEHPGREEWTAAVHRVLAAIEAGGLRKVVLAREVVLDASEPFDRQGILDRLRRSHPSCFTYAAGNFVGATPELLVRRRGDKVVSQPMAGTVARGATPAEDDRLAVGLRRSAKEAEEHGLLVQAVIEALAPACVEVPSAAPAEVVRLATVSHLATRVSGRLRRPAPSALALAGLLHPTPAVGGLPRQEALRAIAELEGFDRGLYAGPIGWVDAAGSGEWAVALRGAELEGSRARLVAGAGIVAGSDADAEWIETEAKLAPMLAAVRAPKPSRLARPRLRRPAGKG